MSKVGRDNYTNFFQTFEMVSTSTKMSNAAAFGTPDGGEVWRVELYAGCIVLEDSHGYYPDSQYPYNIRTFLAF